MDRGREDFRDEDNVTEKDKFFLRILEMPVKIFGHGIQKFDKNTWKRKGYRKLQLIRIGRERREHRTLEKVIDDYFGHKLDEVDWILAFEIRFCW